MYPAGRGAYFDNFAADSLDIHPSRFSSVTVQPDGKLHLLLSGDAGYPLRRAEVDFLAPLRVGMLVRIAVAVGMAMLFLWLGSRVFVQENA